MTDEELADRVLPLEAYRTNGLVLWREPAVPWPLAALAGAAVGLALGALLRRRSGRRLP